MMCETATTKTNAFVATKSLPPTVCSTQNRDKSLSECTAAKKITLNLNLHTRNVHYVNFKHVTEVSTLDKSQKPNWKKKTRATKTTTRRSDIHMVSLRVMDFTQFGFVSKIRPIFPLSMAYNANALRLLHGSMGKFELSFDFLFCCLLHMHAYGFPFHVQTLHTYHMQWASPPAENN